MKTVQRVPRSHGLSARHACAAKSATAYPNELANVSMKEPQPDEQASLISMRLSTPWSTKMAFMSCPPMSSMNDTCGSMSRAAR
jgi:hypothetical protein